MTTHDPSGQQPHMSVPPYRLVAGPTAPAVVSAPVLDDVQRAVVEHRGGPLLLLAGPGTGKTTTIIESVLARLEAGAEPESVVVLTFSRKAAAALRERISARLASTARQPTVTTFHSLCYSLVRQYTPNLAESGPSADSLVRLLTAPEQDFQLREALNGSSAVIWPAALQKARSTRGFVTELRGLLARARHLGMDPDDVVAVGKDAKRSDWQAAGHFFEEYLQLLDYAGALDYSELVHRTRLLLADATIGPQIRARVSTVFVDEYQDTDPAQVGLLRQLVGRGGDIVAVGDPDQSIYGFRGTSARTMGDFADEFGSVGHPARTLALTTTRRFGSAIATVASSVANRLPLVPGIDAGLLREFRAPMAVGAPGRVEAYTYDTEGAQAEHVADLLRRAHLHDSIAWCDMAVLVRSARASIPALGRALVASGVPVEIAGDEIPLAAELAVKPLLAALRTIESAQIDAETASRLLLSPLGGLDSMGLRRLGRTLRSHERLGLAGSAIAQRSGELIARALCFPEYLSGIPETPETAALTRLAGLLAQARATADAADQHPRDVLWTLWQGTDWPKRLRQASACGGEAGRQADRDLDAICALFNLAERKEQTHNRGLRDLLVDVENQQIPADISREDETRGNAVRLLTAHRSKGLEWELVVVAGVQEGTWPDLRRRSSLLEADRLSRDGEVAPTTATELLAEERRLFYVACTRARRRLIVTAVEGTQGEGDQPSRFLADLGVSIRPLSGRPRRPLTISGLVAELRATAVDPSVSSGLRAAAVERLARLADERDGEGRPLAPAADPAAWWGMRTTSSGTASVFVDGQPLVLRGSSLAQLLECPRAWFLSHEVHAERVSTGSAKLGEVIHRLAQHAAGTGIGLDALTDGLDAVWDLLPYEAPWHSATERAEAEAALARYLEYDRASPRKVVGVELPFQVDLEVGGVPVRLLGRVDRLEQGSDGLHIVDFKTGRAVPTEREIAQMDQLGLYQLAVAEGAFEEQTGSRIPGGAQAVYLRAQDGQTPYPKVKTQASLAEVPFPAGAPQHLEDPTWVHSRIREAIEILTQGSFPARVCDSCQYCAFAGSCPARNGRQVVT